MTDPQALVVALSEAATAMETSDAIAAGEAMDRVAAVIAALTGGGAQLSPAQLTEAGALLGRCRTAAQGIEVRLREQMEQAGASRRAIVAYER